MRPDLVNGAHMAVRRTLDQQALRRVLANPVLTQKVLAKNAPPRLLDLQQASAETHDTAESLLTALLGAADADAIAQYQAEYDAVALDLARREQTTERLYPEYFTVEEQMSRLLYLAVRLTRPKVLLETGVADGRSTAITLAALHANEEGELHSVEISQAVGNLVTDRSRWHLHVVDPTTVQFEDVVRSLPRIDVFLHDGDHSYDAQTREYEAVWPRMTPGSLFLSDDVDYTWAFLRFLQRRNLRPHLLMERRKAVGAVLR